jgi:putative ABC transport system permease protein
VKGDRGKALEHANSMAISESAAKILFGTNDPINQIITIKHPFSTRGKEVEFVITAVFEDFPSNTFFRPKYLLNVYGLRTLYGQEGIDFAQFMEGMDLQGGFFMTYFRMPSSANTKGIEKELVRLSDAAAKSDSAFFANGSRITPILAPFLDMHFYEGVTWSFGAEAGNKKSVLVLAGIAVLILIIAAINYMNLATARSTKRAKEVGVRKTLGSKRTDLAFQFFQESAITTFVAVIVAIVLIIIFLPYFNQLANKTFSITSLFNPFFILCLVGIALFVSVLGGSYPALYLSGFNPSVVLKGRLPGGGKSDSIRKILVTFQFVIAILLIVSTLVIIQQMDLMYASKLNEKGKQIVSIRYGTVAENAKYPALKNELLNIKDIDLVTIGNHLPRHDYFGGMRTTLRFRDIDDKDYEWNNLNADYDFPKTFDLELVSGRDFDVKNVSDSNSVLVNEQAVAALHRTASDILGMEVENTRNQRKARIIGVVKDFPFESAKHAIGPLVISSRPNDFDRIVYVKLPASNFSEKLQEIERAWKTVMPGVGFDYWFVNDEFGRLYKQEKKVASLAVLFAALAMCITILGLYGLASYMAEQTTKEIGIRKVLGASVSQVIFLFTVTFLKIFAVALLISVPLGYYFISQWLETFTYRIFLQPPVFIVSAFVVLGLMLITVLYETMKAARANPINALKHE